MAIEHATKPEQGKPAPPPPIDDDEIRTLTARLRINEERNSELRRKLLVVEQNMLTNHKQATNEIKTVQQELTELRHTMHIIEDKIMTVIKELRLTARKEDIQLIKKYLEIWKPVKFATLDKVEELIDEKLHPGKHSDHAPPNYDSPR
ncbi:hypothetical protein COV18_04220 [Candidatus Woesearchaeota archaeon CG10_big_fil_rev_8_21_14_0_10_37_12]|nr:MAG: hypothetical protein COV18_04220 [Candidatus Woesearchaeota archaeon CG10_big_fil_rev_8_21_14_0_10_37_12]